MNSTRRADADRPATTNGTAPPRVAGPPARTTDGPPAAPDAPPDGPPPVGAPPTGAGIARGVALRVAFLVLASAVLAVIVAFSIAVGSKNIPLATVWESFVAFNDSNDHVIIRDLRIPRTLLGLLTGTALGVAGALIQALTRNPLADPGILGVNAGAAFAAVAGIALFGLTSLTSYIWFAFAGAVCAAVTVYLIGSRGRGGATPVRLTMAGVALGAVLGGVSSGITLIDRDTFDRMRFWTAGSLTGRDMAVVGEVTPFILTGLVIALVLTRSLNTIALGDDTARALGANLGRTRLLGVVAVTLLCGAATAAVGPIGFIGLMVPHIARWIVGPDQRWIVASALLLSPVLLLTADIIGRIAVRPGELQAGIVTAFIGVPVLIALVRRTKVSGL
ncbi:iron complex transport system permease protein [Sinosporangium album]|uniref:Iron complex transport system permease protein n=1 Tax=Sinosporangium album TaxID=504805 RepID=A0A1G8KLQ7_9ACTN|nr:iron chelate uptake ABC transporter family permease subunit [Sinosporangium album]SDI44312.1 iron complex transport system permease protein [Sinosporangium album]